MSRRPAHLPALDGLRGLAILMVIAHNAQLLEAPEMHGAAKLVLYLFTQGWVGVQLFFVLSGFLITGILLDTLGRDGALKSFMARRALRIFPLYYGALLLIFVILPLLNAQPDMYRAQAPYQVWLWAYLSNWTDPMGIGPKALGHFWSLAVEEQFYLLWPLVVFLLGSARKVAWAAVAVAVGALACRAWMLHADFHADVVYSWTICRIDALVLGGLAAAVWRVPAWADWAKRHGWSLVSSALLMMAAVAAWTHGLPRVGPRTLTLGYSVLALFCAVVIYVAAWRDAHPGVATGRDGAAVGSGGAARGKPLWHRFLTLGLLRHVGKYSYGMYVIHKPLHDLFSMPVLRALKIQPEGSVPLASLHVLGVMVITYAAAWLSYHLYEVHFLNLKRHFEPRGRAVASSAA